MQAFELKGLYNALERTVKQQNNISDAHARNMARLAAEGAFDQFKIWFRQDLRSLGLDCRLSWQVTKVANEPVEV